jgi:hypothetical protein
MSPQIPSGSLSLNCPNAPFFNLFACIFFFFFFFFKKKKKKKKNYVERNIPIFFVKTKIGKMSKIILD